MALQQKASTVGFDWNDPRAVLDKIREEADEIEAALDRGDKSDIASETGDLMFALVNLARHVDADPEMALREANAKFERRFGYIERTLAAKRLARWRARLLPKWTRSGTRRRRRKEPDIVSEFPRIRGVPAVADQLTRRSG